MSAGVSWFPKGVAGRGTDRRAGGLQQLYRKKLLPLDSRYHNTPPGQAGPLVRRLQSYGKLEGLVVGPWGEVSKDMHRLVKVLAESKLAAKARARGRDISDRELGLITTQIRKYLATAFVRDLARRLEVGRRREREAHFQAHIRGQGLSRIGMNHL